jgi:hypothetical protein
MLTPNSVSRCSSRSSLCIPGLWDVAVEVYCDWHCSQVRSPEQQRHFRQARDLTLERGYDLELVHEDHNAQYYIEQGVLEGVARRWVRDVELFLEQYMV